MIEYIPSKKFEDKIRASMAVPDASPVFVDTLRERLVTKAKKQVIRKPRTQRLRLARVILTALFLVLFVATLVIGPQRVWAAVKSLFGYLPGVGYVQTDDSLRVLVEPVFIEREGVVFKVEEAVTDALRTVIVYKVEGLSVQAANSQGESGPFGPTPYLRLPDGTELELISGEGSGWGIGYENRLVFPALPSEVHEVFFVVPVLESMPIGAAPEDWEAYLRFEPAQADMTLQSVYEMNATDADTETQIPSEASSIPNLTIDDHSILFSLDRVVELEDGFIFEGNVSWEELDRVDRMDYYFIILTDANGQNIPFERISPDSEHNLAQQQAWAIRTNSKAYPGPWKFSVPSIGLHITSGVEFQVDLGPEPQLDQEWPYDYVLEAAGHQVRLTFMRLYQGPNEDNWLEFKFMGEPDLINIELGDPDNKSAGVASKIGLDDNGQIISAFTYDYIPSGVRKIVVSGIVYQQDGPWQIVWYPPVEISQLSSTQTPLPQVCLTLEMWQQLKTQPQVALPGDLSGQLLIQTHTGLMLPLVSFISLNGEQRQDIDIGAWVSLSPDGKKVAFPKEDGIYLANSVNGEFAYLNGTRGGGYPIWSPDGEWIAFHIWNEQSIYRVRVDGSSLERVYQGADVVYLSDWTPEGRQIIYLGFGESGMKIQAIDVETGAKEILLQTEVNKPTSRPAFFPSGDWIAYQDEVFGQIAKGIFIARPDGSDKRLLVAIQTNIGVGVGAWSPDGQWLVVNIHDMNEDTTNAIPVLINVDTCQVISLLDLRGEVVGWRPADIP